MSYVLTSKQKAYLPFKRFLDLFFSFLLIILLLPLMLIVCFINCFFTGFKPLFFQKRNGKKNKPFTIIKLRTLKTSAPSYEERCSSDQYTKIGFLLRKTHLDELWQLFNIFIGQMSFIGPRPIILSLKEQIDQRHKDGTDILRPGLSGLAQINERDMPLSQSEKCKYDKTYLEKLSLGFDTKLVFLTIGVVFVNSFRKNKQR